MSRPAGPRRAPGGAGGVQNINSTVSIVVAAVAVVLGFFILRDINDDNGGTTSGGDTTATTLVTDTTIAGATTSVAPGPTTGFKVQVVNAAGVSGAAGDLTVALQGAGYIVQPPLTKSDATPKQTVTKVYYVAGYEAAAASVAGTLGGVETGPMPDPIPSETGNLGEASVMVLLGTDLAGQPLPGAAPVQTTLPAATTTTPPAG
jgi:hypothetical protein